MIYYFGVRSSVYNTTIGDMMIGDVSFCHPVGECDSNRLNADGSNRWKYLLGGMYIYTSKPVFSDDNQEMSYFVVISDIELEFDSIIEWFGGLCDTGDKMLVEVILENGQDIIPTCDAPRCTRKRGRDDVDCDMGDDGAKRRQCC